MKKWHALLTLVVCTVISLRSGLYLWLELPPDYPGFEIGTLNRQAIIPWSFVIGGGVAAIITNLVGVELTEQERECYITRRNNALATAVLGFLLLGVLALMPRLLLAPPPWEPLKIVFCLCVLMIPFLLLGLGRGAGGGGEAKDTIERKHYDRRGRYKGYSRQHGDTIKHYDEQGRLTGESGASRRKKPGGRR